jgi:uncharacterized protein
MTRPRTLKRIILQLDDTPNRVAASFGLGIFIAFFPLLGIHILSALALSALLRLNRVALIAATFANNPWTIAPMYTAGTLLGCAILGVSPSSLAGVEWSLTGLELLHSVRAGLGPLLLPFVVGNLLLGIVSGIASFFVVRAVLLRNRAAEGKASSPRVPPPAGGAAA